MHAISARGIGRTFRGASGYVEALSSIDLAIPSGAITIISGPSGSGKTTLLGLLGLLDAPTSGKLHILGVDVLDLSDAGRDRWRRENIAFLFQDGGLIDHMSVFDNVALPLRYRRLDSSELGRRVRSSLDALGLTARESFSVNRLSGGERQRVGLARALVSNLPILICDEPTASLDADNSRLIAEWLKRLARAGACVVCASHDPIMIESASVAIRLERGRREA